MEECLTFENLGSSLILQSLKIEETLYASKDLSSSSLQKLKNEFETSSIQNEVVDPAFRAHAFPTRMASSILILKSDLY